MQGEVAYFIRRASSGEMVTDCGGWGWFAWKEEAENHIQQMVKLGLWQEGQYVIGFHRSNY